MVDYVLMLVCFLHFKKYFDYFGQCFFVFAFKVEPTSSGDGQTDDGLALNTDAAAGSAVRKVDQLVKLVNQTVIWGQLWKR
jgi:hypothetical protein